MKLGPPAEGEVVQVKWPDGKLYGAKYLGSNVAHMYQVSAILCEMFTERKPEGTCISSMLLMNRPHEFGAPLLF